MIAGGHVLLFVENPDVAVRFYVETLGMKLVEEASELVIDAGEGFLIGLQKRPAGVSPSATTNGPIVRLRAKLPIAQAIDILENRGVSFTVRKEAGLTLADFTDGDGNRLCLYGST